MTSHGQFQIGIWISKKLMCLQEYAYDRKLIFVSTNIACFKISHPAILSQQKKCMMLKSVSSKAFGHSGEGESGMIGESSIETYTLPYVK